VGVEIEAKLKVNDLSVVRQRLEAIGGCLRSNVLESNMFFDTEDRALLAKDQGLRVRHTLNRSSHEETTTITFKGPRRQGTLKSREERELKVGSVKDATSLLEALGYARVLTFQKRRESWLVKECDVELDELPYLGVYVEIEGPSEAAVLEVREMLQLSDRPLIRASYVALLMTHLQERNLNERVVIFK
jgi:adenylate cyclase class 2